MHPPTPRARSCPSPAAAARRLLHQEPGFTGAEKALLICFALAIVVLVGALVQRGTETAGRDAERVLATAQGRSGALGQVAPIVQAAQVDPPGGTPAASGTVEAAKEGPGFFGQVGGFFTGLYEGGKDTVVGLAGMAKGAWNLTGGWITNPDEAGKTWEGLKGSVTTIFTDPGKVWDAIKEPYVTAWSEGRYGEAIGRGTFEVVTAVLGTKGLDKAGKVGKIADAGADLGKVRKLDKASDIEKAGDLGKAGKPGKPGKPDGDDVPATPPRPRVPTPDERALAAQAGDTLAQQAARRVVAEDFYVNQSGWPGSRAQNHLSGIDFSKPVQIVDVPAGKLDQWVAANGKVGNYFAPVGTPAGELGINPAGRSLQTFDIPPGTRGLQSTAAEILDTWSDPAKPYKAKGGGTQIFVTDAQRDAILAHNKRP